MTQEIDKELVRRLKVWFEGGRANPYKFDIFFTNKCNLKCKFCNFPNLKDHTKELSDEEILDLVRQAGELDVRVFGVLGGEPFVRKSAIQAMKIAKNFGMAGSLVTNGTLINKHQILDLIDMKWDLVRFSIDGADAETHDYLRGVNGSFDKSLSALKMFNQIKEETGSTYPTLEINTVLCKKNLTDVPKILDLAAKLNIKNVYFLPMIPFVKNLNSLIITKKDMKIFLDSLDQIDPNHKVNSNLDEIKNELISQSDKMDQVILSEGENQDNYIPCFMPWYGMSVDAEGYATPCGQIEKDNQENIRRNLVKDIWFGDWFSKLRGKMLKRVLSKGCNKCCMPLLDENRLLRKELLKND